MIEPGRYPMREGVLTIAVDRGTLAYSFDFVPHPDPMEWRLYWMRRELLTPTRTRPRGLPPGPKAAPIVQRDVKPPNASLHAPRARRPHARGQGPR